MDAALNAAQRARASKDAKEKETAAKANQDAEKAFAQAQEDTLTAAKPILADVGKSLTSDALDAPQVKCAALARRHHIQSLTRTGRRARHEAWKSLQSTLTTHYPSATSPMHEWHEIRHKQWCKCSHGNGLCCVHLLTIHGIFPREPPEFAA